MRSPPCMLPRSTLTRPALRLRLMQLLPTDAEFEAFCVDYFPQTQQLFGGGMERMQKLNLLLAREKLSTIDRALAKLCAKPAEFPRGAVRRTARTIVVTGLTLLISFGLLLATVAILHLPASPAQTAQQPKHAMLQTVPSGAEIWDLRSGEFLGHTPWTLNPNHAPLHICLQLAGFHDETLMLGEAEPVVPLRLRPSPASLPTEAIENSNKEVCDVPLRMFK